MSSKTYLLVTDDPDDHQAFSEAIAEISMKTIVLIVLDSERALEWLHTKKYIPDSIFVDLSMHGIRINSFLKSINGGAYLSNVPIVVYGPQSSFELIEDKDRLVFFNKDYEYSELRGFLKKLIYSDPDDPQ
jgi:hypothetical protein